MKMRFLSLSVLLLSSSVFADANNYNYVDIEYEWAEVESLDFNGFSVSGRFEATEEIFISGSYGKISDDESAFDADLTSYTIGAGYIFSQAPTSSAYVRAAYIRADLDLAVPDEAISADDTGYVIAAGGRLDASDAIELFGELGLIDGRQDGFYGNLGALFNISETFGLSATYNSADSDPSYAVGVRFSW